MVNKNSLKTGSSEAFGGSQRNVLVRALYFPKKIIDRILMRTSIWTLQERQRIILNKISAQDAKISRVEKSVAVILAKVDAYADIDDRNQIAFLTQLTQLHDTVKVNFAALEMANASLEDQAAEQRKSIQRVEALFQIDSESTVKVMPSQRVGIDVGVAPNRSGTARSQLSIGVQDGRND